MTSSKSRYTTVFYSIIRYIPDVDIFSRTSAGHMEDIVIDEESSMISVLYERGFFEFVPWNMSTCEMITGPIHMHLENDSIYGAISSDDGMMVTGSSNGTVQRYCARSGDKIGQSMRAH